MDTITLIRNYNIIRSPVVWHRHFPRCIEIYKIRNVQQTRDSVDELKKQYNTFVGVCYVFIHTHRQKIISK